MGLLTSIEASLGVVVAITTGADSYGELPYEMSPIHDATSKENTNEASESSLLLLGLRYLQLKSYAHYDRWSHHCDNRGDPWSCWNCG